MNLQRASQRLRRALVLVALVPTVVLGSSLPPSLHGWGIVIVSLLVAIDVILVQATGGLAFARARGLDERQFALRNQGHRRAFRLLGLEIILMALLVGFTSFLGPQSQTDDGMRARVVAALLELLVMTPTFVIAWSVKGAAAPGAPEDDPGSATRGGRVSWLAVPGVVMGWFALVALAPLQPAVPSASFTGSTTGFSGAPFQCRAFAWDRVVGDGVGAHPSSQVQACWDGRTAFVMPTGYDSQNRGPVQFPDPADTRPITPQRLVMDCGPMQDDFASISAICTADTNSLGTVHYSMRTRVSPLPFALGRRDLRWDVVVSRDGRVLTS